MLDYADFKKEFIANCRGLLADIAATGDADSEFGGVEIEQRSVTKAQRGELAGLIVRTPNTVCAPTYYVEDYYDLYKEGSSPEELAASLVQSALHYLHKPPVFPEIDAENLKNALDDSIRFGVRLLNEAENRAYLRDVPHICESGLALIAELRSGEYCAVVTNGLMESLGMTKDELFERAVSGSVTNDRATLYELAEMFCSDFTENVNLLESLSDEDLPLPASLYVLSNEDCFRGAAALFYPGMLDRLGNLMGGRFYVLPSSVHEVLILPAVGDDPQKLADIIKEANRTVTESDVFLSDELYVCESGRLRQISFGGIVPSPGTLPC